MANKFVKVFFGVFLAIFLIAGKQTYAQREIRVFEPDFSKAYAIHLALYKKLPRSIYPNAYIEFYSNYVNHHDITKYDLFYIDRSHNKVKMGTYVYNKNGFISKIDRYQEGELVESTVFEYSNHNRTITKHSKPVTQYAVKNATELPFHTEIYYFNKNYLIDSIYNSDNGVIIFVRGTNKLINEIITPKEKIDLKQIDYAQDFENSGTIFKSMGHYSPQALFFKQLRLDSIAGRRDSIIGMAFHKSPQSHYSSMPDGDYTEIHLAGNYLFIKEKSLSGYYPLSTGRNSSQFYQWDAKNTLSVFAECYENIGNNMDFEFGNYYSKMDFGWKVRYYNWKGDVIIEAIIKDGNIMSWPRGATWPKGEIEFFK